MKITPLKAEGIHRREVDGIATLTNRLPGDWYGYANLEAVNPRMAPREIDVVIVLDDRVLIADIKDWWGGIITYSGGKWLRNGNPQGSSPVDKILDNRRRLGTMINGHLIRKKAGERAPLVDGCVIMTGDADFSRLPEGEKQFVFGIDDFCRMIVDKDKRNERLTNVRIVSDKKILTRKDTAWSAWFDDIFKAGNYFKPRNRVFGAFRVVSDVIYKHKGHGGDLYTEYDAKEVETPDASGLLRYWDFSKGDAKFLSDEGRADVIGRERRVLHYLRELNSEFDNALLPLRQTDEERGIRYWEVFERRRQTQRLSQFMLGDGRTMDASTRIDLVRVMLSHASRMHGLDVAHCDIGDHSVWLELPSTVRFSHLFAARIPEGRTVAEERYSTLARPVVYPEIYVSQTNNLFAKDVYLLACVAHHLLLGAPPKAGPDEPAIWDPLADSKGAFTSLHPWLARGLEMDVKARYSDAAAMLEAFNAATKPIQADADTLERLHRFRGTHKQFFSYARVYPQEGDTVVETDRVLIYPSSKNGRPLMVKKWSRDNWRDERTDGSRLLAFCEQVRDLADLGLEGICPIHEIVYLSDGIVVVLDRVDAVSLQDVLGKPRDAGPFRDSMTALNFLKGLIKTVNGLHAQGFAHGDLTPSNILCPRDESEAGERVRPLLIDVIDLPAHGEGERLTREYAPKGSSTPAERDRCGVMKIAEHLLAWSDLQNDDMLPLAKALHICRNQEPVFGTLEPLVDALEALHRPAVERLTLTVARPIGVSDEVVLRPDAGEYHLRIWRHGLQATLHVTGASSRLEIPLDAARKATDARLVELSQDAVGSAQHARCDSVNADIRLIPNAVFDPESVQPLLDRPEIVKALDPRGQRGLDSKLDEPGQEEGVDPDPFTYQETEADLDREADEAMLASLSDLPKTLPASQDTGDAGLSAERSAPDTSSVPATQTPEPSAASSARPVEEAPVVDVANLWRTLMDVEMEDIVEAVIDRDAVYSPRGTLVVRYRPRRGQTDFDVNDTVNILVMNRHNEWRKAGILDLVNSRPNEAVIIPPRFASDVAGKFAVGKLMRFESQKSQKSRDRKERALTRILKGDSAIPNLLGYFTHHNAEWVKAMRGGIPDPDWLRAAYDLNESQIGAFIRLWTTGFLGLLQGPPGTGKTTFIAAFVHYALTVGGMGRILLVSQSHEAVDNAAKGVIDLFHRTGKAISLVRVGNKADVQSDTVRPYHMDNLEERYREEFRARIKEKILVVGKRLGLDRVFLDKFHGISVTIRPILKNIAALADELRQDVLPRDPFSEASRKHGDLEETVYRLLAGIGITTSQISAAGYRVTLLGQSGNGSAASPGRSVVSQDEAGRDVDFYGEEPGIDDGVFDLASPDAFEILTDVLAHLVHGERRPIQKDVLRRLLAAIDLMDDWLGSVASRHRNIEEFLVNTRQVVCGTCVGIGNVSLGIRNHFDLVIIDEAARATAGELAVPMHMGKRVILVGDHKQLPPFHISAYVAQTARRTKLDRDEVRRSDFERAFTSPYGQAVGQTLQTQYRMLEPIGRLVSEVFYKDSPLDHGRKTPKAPTTVWPKALSRAIIWLDTKSYERDGFEKRVNGTSRSNRVESRAILRMLRVLDTHAPFQDWLRANKDSDNPLEFPIGIICPYQAQVDMIEQSLVTAISPALREAIRVDTVDGYQGKENLLVILSVVRNNDEGPPSDSDPWTISPGFLSQSNRINVAVSRAMDRLVVVGTTKGWHPECVMARLVNKVDALAKEELALISDAKGI